MRWRAARTLAIPIAASLLAVAGCGSGPDTGPGEVAWDRDVCEYCEMVIGERRFAAQVREAATGRLHRFDDLGCAVLWLAAREPADPSGGADEIWIRDAADRSWIDARKARFSTGHRTPMGHGFAAVAGEPAGSLDLTEVTRRLLAGHDERRHPGH